MTKNYYQLLDGTSKNLIGERGVGKEDIASLLPLINNIIDDIRVSYQRDDEINIYNIVGKTQDLAEIEEISGDIKNNFKELVVYGIGGSSLGGRTLSGINYDYNDLNQNKTNIRFIDNIDYYEFQIMLDSLNLESTAFLVISKSGNTIETLSQLLFTMDYLKAKNIKDLGKHFVFITEDNKSNPILTIALDIKARKILYHEKNIGGRYSCFTNVGLLPARVSGLDCKLIRKGAKDKLEDALNNKNSDVLLGIATNFILTQKGFTSNVIIPYIQRLSHFADWYAQLWAESLGKEGKGSTPIKAMGSVDQHSQLQLYLEGPSDKQFIFITYNSRNMGSKLSNNYMDIDSISYLKNRHLGDIMFAEQKSTIACLIQNQRPVREFFIEKFDEETLGSLMMHFMLETVITAGLMKINPFDQPAVEKGKVIAKDMLRSMI